jgi:tetratricopeptide (TPR) repeat protein
MAAIDQKQHLTAGWLVTQSLASAANESAIINLAGAVGSGKTSVLRLTERLLRQRSKTPLFLSAPATDAETSAIVLAEAADGLAQAGCLNGAADVLRDPTRRWFDKFDAITKVIGQDPDRFVLICDEPSHWFRQSASEVDDTPDHHARVLSDWIFKQAKCRRIVSGYVPSGLPRLKRTQAPRIEDGRTLLEDRSFWATAANLASAVSAATKRSIEFGSVMEIRLLVAWAWLFSPQVAAKQCELGFSATSLLESLLDALEQSSQKNPGHRSFCQAMARLAIGRVDLPNVLYDELVSDLSLLERDIIRGCLCEECLQFTSLHPLVRYEVLTRQRDRKRSETHEVWRLSTSDRTIVHNRLYDVANQRPPGESWRTDIEALHHGVLSRRLESVVDEHRLHFVEQLHEIGRALSYVFRQHHQAADVFRFALSLDDHNAYSHHYLAFNLDWCAEAEQEVETHYQKAIDLQPEHPWWWSRWISYLATRGRFKEASNQWRDALDALSVAEGSTPDWVYMSLHRWVARWMLHWSNLDLADNILRSIPSGLTADPSIARLNDLLIALRFAERGRAVFPLSIPASMWWTPNPHTNLPLAIVNQRLTMWLPARIQYVDPEGELFVMFAKPPSDAAEQAEFDEMKMDRSSVEAAAFQFRWNDLREGRFIELGYYGDAGSVRIGLHPDGLLNDADLIPLVPPPNRWYERAVAASWNEVGGNSE